MKFRIRHELIYSYFQVLIDDLKHTIISFVCIILFLVAVAYPARLKSQPSLDSSRDLQAKLLQAENHLTSYKNDSALIISNTLLKQLKANATLDSRFGIRVQYVEATALEQKEQGDQAITKLLHIEELSQKKYLWDIHAKSCLGLALIYEKIDQKVNSLKFLKKAEESINVYRLGHIYPYFAVRMASWERIFNSKKKALYYAEEALRTAPKYNLRLEKAIGHMLMNILLPEQHVELRLYHCLNAIKIYKELEDHTGCSYMYHAITKIYFQNKDFSRSISYSDSSISTAHKAMQLGHSEHQTIGKIYTLRGDIFKALGNHDSAWFYKDLGYKLAVATLEKNMGVKILGIENDINHKKEQQEIRAFKMSLYQKNAMLSVAILLVIFLLIVGYRLYLNYRKQRVAKVLLSQQNSLIKSQAEQLRLLDTKRTRFFNNVSHELRTPLMMVLGPIKKLLEENDITYKQAKYLQMATQSGDELTNLINEILDLGKIDAGKLEVHEKPTELASFFEIHLSQFESLAQRNGIAYRINHDIPNEYVALIDQEKYRHILNNLLSNAFKFTSKGQSIEVRLSLKQDLLSLTVTDTGQGIHPQDIPFIFDRYYQGDRAGIHGSGSTGIGLSICQEYVRLLGGTICATSQLGKNTVFHATFPIKMASEKILSANCSRSYKTTVDHFLIPTPSESKERSPRQNTSTIMIVEDNLKLCDYIKLLLEQEFNVAIANNGEEALHKILSGFQCDIILTDLVMPVMDGYQLLTALKSNDATRGLPVIILTARADPDDKLKALRIGVDDYLTKPFNEYELKARIYNLLKNRYLRQETNALGVVWEKTHSIINHSDQIWLEKFEKYIQEHYPEEGLSVPELAYEFAMSESTLLRQLKRLTGLTPGKYIQEVRLNQARTMLETGCYDSISQIALKVGYKDIRTFSRSFKERFGKVPSELLNSA